MRADSLIRSVLESGADWGSGTSGQPDSGGWDPEWGRPGNDFDEPGNRAWLSPKGDVHKLGAPRGRDAVVQAPGAKASREGHPPWFPTETHSGWARRSQHIHGQEDADIDSLQREGWIRKKTSRAYSAYTSDLASHEAMMRNVGAHLKKHHPEVSYALVNTDRDGNIYVNQAGQEVDFRGKVLESSTTGDKINEAAPTAIRWGDKNWMQSREHAWISPEGEYHKLGPKEHHSSTTKAIGGTARNGIRAQDDMIRGGWIRKADAAIYHVSGNPERPHESPHTQRVFDHIEDHHPEVDRVSILFQHEVEGQSRAESRDTRFFNRNRETGHWEPERDPPDKYSRLPVFASDVPSSWHPQPTRMESAEESHLASFPQYSPAPRLPWQEYVVSHFAEPEHRGWVSPQGEVHTLPSFGHGFTHMGWVEQNAGSKADPSHLEDTALDTERKMVQGGWVRKVASDYYEAHESQLGRVAAHLRQRHPEVKRAVVRVRQGNQRGTNTLKYTTIDQQGNLRHPKDFEPSTPTWQLNNPPQTSEHTRADALIGSVLESAWKEYAGDHFPEPNEAWQREPDFMKWVAGARNHAWIDPEDNVHTLEGRHHGDFAVEHPKYGQIARDADKEEGFGVSRALEAMTKDGWIRKFDHDQYGVEDESQIPRVFAHIKKHAPEDLESFTVTKYSDNGRDVHEFQKEDGKWYTPEGHVVEHTLPDFVRGASKDTRMRVAQALKAGLEARKKKPKPKQVKEAQVFDRDRDFQYTGERAWITPDEKVHSLETQKDPFRTHFKWVRERLDRVPRELRVHDGKCFSCDPDPDGNPERECQHTLGGNLSRLKMTKAGWIRKISAATYDAHPDHWGRVLDHVRKSHPEIEAVDILHHNNDLYDAVDKVKGQPRAMLALDNDTRNAKTTTLNVKTGEVVHRESRADQLIKDVLAEVAVSFGGDDAHKWINSPDEGSSGTWGGWIDHTGKAHGKEYMGPVHKDIADHLGFKGDGRGYFEGYRDALRAHHSRFLVTGREKENRNLDLNVHCNSAVAIGHAMDFIKKHGTPGADVNVKGHRHTYDDAEWIRSGSVDDVLKALHDDKHAAAFVDPNEHIPEGR